MLLDGTVAHEQGLRDGRVVAARGHDRENFPLAVGEPQQRPVIGSTGEQRLDHQRVEDGTATSHLSQCADQLVQIADSLLEQVAPPGHAIAQQVEGVVLLDVLREDDDTDLGMLGVDPSCRLDALVRVRRRHPDVGEHRVG